MSSCETSLCERRVSVTLLQEPYVKHGRVAGLLLSMDVIVYESESIKAAVIVNDPKLDVIYVRECKQLWCVRMGKL